LGIYDFFDDITLLILLFGLSILIFLGGNHYKRQKEAKEKENLVHRQAMTHKRRKN
jgi:hypothetical protein